MEARGIRRGSRRKSPNSMNLKYNHVAMHFRCIGRITSQKTVTKRAQRMTKIYGAPFRASRRFIWPRHKSTLSSMRHQKNSEVRARTP